MNKKLIIVMVALGIGMGLLCGSLGPMAALGFMALIAMAAITLLNYDVGVYVLAAYGVMDTFIRAYVGALASVWDELFLIALVFLWALKWIIARKEDNFKMSPVDIPLIIFIAVMLVCLILNSTFIAVGIEGFRAIVQYMLWYFIVLQLVKGESSAKGITLVFVLIVGLLSLHGVYQYAIGVEMPAGWVDQAEAGVRTRVFSIFTSPNIFGSLLAMAIPMAISLAFVAKKNSSKLLFALMALSMAGALVFTFSRGAWIGFAVSMVVYILLKDKRLVIPFILLGIIVIIAVPSVGDRIGYMLSSDYIESSLRGGRLIRWLTGLEILSNNKLLGVGLGHFGGAVAMNNNLAYLVGYVWTKTFYMDNYMLKTAVESGLIGFGAFAMLIYSVIINSIRTIRLADTKISKELTIGILSGLCAVIIHNFTENVFEVPMMTSLFWMFVAVIMGVWFELDKKFI